MKKQRIDSAAGALRVTADALDDVQPPIHCNLRPRDWPFWRSIVLTRSSSEWTAPDLENAANLARCKADIEKLQTEIDREGDIVVNDRGTPIVNPRHALLETLSRRSVALARMLHVHAEATSGKAGKESGRNKAHAQARQAVADADDDLIARPPSH